MSTDDALDLLPKRAAELVHIVGFEAAMILIKEFGGTHLNIPKKAKSRHKLVVYIGFEAVEKLCHYYAGTQLEIDLCANIINQQKKQLIINSILEGKTNAVIARQFCTTERQIRRIKERMRCVQSVNLDIFESLAS